MPRSHPAFVGIACALAVTGLVACGSSGTKVVETNDGRVTVAKDGKTVTIEGEHGAASFGSSKVPDGFPSEVPLPNGLKLVSSAGAEGSFTLAYAFGSGDEDRVVSSYLTRLADAGLTTTGDTGANPFTSGTAEGKGWRVAASVMTPRLLTVLVTPAS